MSTYLQVDPESFIDTVNNTPEHGRGAWSKSGIGFSTFYKLSPPDTALVGSEAEVSLDHWAVSAAVGAIQRRLRGLHYKIAIDGVFGPKTDKVVRAYQTKRGLVSDGAVGQNTSKSLWTPVVKNKETKYHIPNNYLCGQTMHESVFDPGAVGFFIFYEVMKNGELVLEYRGVDRAFSQINSEAHAEVTWLDAFNPVTAFEYSGNRMENTFNSLTARNPSQSASVIWDATIVSHNSPLWGSQWAASGKAPNDTAAAYVASVKEKAATFA